MTPQWRDSLLFLILLFAFLFLRLVLAFLLVLLVLLFLLILGLDPLNPDFFGPSAIGFAWVRGQTVETLGGIVDAEEHLLATIDRCRNDDDVEDQLVAPLFRRLRSSRTQRDRASWEVDLNSVSCLPPTKTCGRVAWAKGPC